MKTSNASVTNFALTFCVLNLVLNQFSMSPPIVAGFSKGFRNPPKSNFLCKR